MGWMVDGGIGYRGALPIGALSACFLAARRSVPQPAGWSYGMERHAGLKALEEVIETLMPPAAGRYRADIQRLRQAGTTNTAWGLGGPGERPKDRGPAAVRAGPAHARCYGTRSLEEQETVPRLSRSVERAARHGSV
jgi:hypothetical protein